MLAGVRDDDLARGVVDRLDLVVDGRPAESLRGQHRDRRDDVAGAGERPSAGREPAEPPARRDPDRLAEPELRHVAVERPAVQPVGVDHRLERERRTQRPIERLGLDDVGLDGPVAPHVGLERPDVGVGDLPVALDDLVGVDGHELDAGRCPQGRRRRRRHGRSRRPAGRCARAGSARSGERSRPVEAQRAPARGPSSSERRASSSSNGRSARDRRFESIGAPTVAPCVVMEPWSKPPSTRPVSWSAQTTTGTPGSASIAAIVQAAGTAMVCSTRTTSTSRSANLRPTAAPSSADAISTTATGSIVSARSAATARARAIRSARKVGPAVCSQSVQYGWTTPTRGRGPAGLSGIVSPGGRSRLRSAGCPRRR